MIDCAMLLAATSHRTQVGKLAIRHSAKVPLVPLTYDFTVCFEYPVGRPIFCLGLVGVALATLVPLAFAFGGRSKRRGSRALRRRRRRGAGLLPAFIGA